ncbi:MAG TPA: hydrolase [Candidatus Kapabacteria bacterium]|jgi:isochorismate hydrolase|nr:hydrolase [Candidatus Kapabacteria bacterium]HOQ48295.1 hydrolase [Candidatus Kapabacteria bacterium]HPP40112.1 hydrolase [Candidatus Kapabacteria bacterium]HPU24468.1 hydrolase [Candidatus Kapabacteria bacterium]
MVLTPDNSIALIIDIQSKLLPYIYQNDELINNNARLINGLKLLEVPIIITEQYPKGLGTTSERLIEVLCDAYKPIEKDTFSCLGCDEVLNRLRQSRRKNVIITGIEAHICVMQTVRDLIASDFNPFVVADCISSRKLYDKEYGLKRMLREGAFPSTYESVLMEITHTSKHPKFKEISKTIK